MPLVLLWSMDVLLRMPENGVNYAELVLVDSINFDEKHLTFGPILKNGIVLESSHQTLLIHAIGVIVEHGRLAENA
jgi:hypothetical protein